MTKFPFIVLEGISYSGKTTLSNLCKNKGITVLKELSEICTFPEMPKIREKINDIDEWFFNQHAARIEEIQGECISNAVMLDRYFLSDLAYIYSRYHTYNIGDLDFYLNLINDGIARKKILIPYYIYICIDIETHLLRKKMDEDKRIKERGLNQISRCPSDINQIKFFENQISFYDLFFKKNPENVLIIDGNHSPHLLCQQAIEWIKKLPASISSKTITI